MAGAKFFALIDDIATILDDIAVMTKVAAKKTAGVVGDDLALGAEQLTGIRADREIPIVWAVAQGSFKNKLILVPAALAISALLPWLVVPLLMLGGAFLCYEGVEKVWHKFFPAPDTSGVTHQEHLQALLDPATDLVALEKTKIEGAIRTDFILSAEIIVIALGTLATATFWMRATVLATVAILLTVGVYGLVAVIVKLDDLGLFLSRQPGDAAWPRFQRAFGRWLLKAAPVLMKTLSIAGTIAMFTVGGGILVHGIPFLHSLSHAIGHAFTSLPAFLGGFLRALLPAVFDAAVGVATGMILVAASSLVKPKPSAGF